jgi:hypothetical protein
MHRGKRCRWPDSNRGTSSAPGPGRTSLLAAGCGGGNRGAQEPPPRDAAEDAKGGGARRPSPWAPVVTPPAVLPVESKTGAEALEDSPFELNQRQSVPPTLGRPTSARALIVVAFIKENRTLREGSSTRRASGRRAGQRGSDDLREDYPQVEFFHLRHHQARQTRRAARIWTGASTVPSPPSWRSATHRSWRCSLHVGIGTLSRIFSRGMSIGVS